MRRVPAGSGARRPRLVRSARAGEMHVVVNEKLISTRVKIASAAHLAALAVFAVGLFISWSNPEPTYEQMAGAYAAIIVGLILYNVGQMFLRRFGPRSRAEGVLARTLKGLDRRYTLVAFPSTKLPDYTLVGPAGIQVIVTRPHDGAISYRAGNWVRDAGSGLKRLSSLFGGTPFGDPTKDVEKGIARVRERLEKAGIEPGKQPPIDGVIVFTNPNAKLRIDGSTYPVTTLKGLRNNVRGGKGQRERALDDRSAGRVVQALTG
jgi:hypothetical protein